MKANEFRISNLVSYLPNKESLSFGKVTGLYNTTYDEKKVVVDYHYPLSFFEPTLLTPEILEKCGFTVNAYACFKHTSEDAYIFYTRETGAVGISISIEGSEDTEEATTYLKIDHLHQLQNLYFALTGEELEIAF